MICLFMKICPLEYCESVKGEINVTKRLSRWSKVSTKIPGILQGCLTQSQTHAMDSGELQEVKNIIISIDTGISGSLRESQKP